MKRISFLVLLLIFSFTSIVTAAPAIQTKEEILKEFTTQASKIEDNLVRMQIGVMKYRVNTDSKGVFVQSSIQSGITDFDKELTNIAFVATKINSFKRPIQRTEITLYSNFNPFYLIKIPAKETKLFAKNKITLDKFMNTWSLVPLSPPNEQQVNNNSNEGLVLYSNDGKTYLGKLTSDEFDSDSIFNEYGTYGSKYSQYSIWNEYGDYGSKYSDESAFNKFAQSPPMIINNGEIIGYLTINKYIVDAVSPIDLKETLKNQGL